MSTCGSQDVASQRLIRASLWSTASVLTVDAVDYLDCGDEDLTFASRSNIPAAAAAAALFSGRRYHPGPQLPGNETPADRT